LAPKPMSQVATKSRLPSQRGPSPQRSNRPVSAPGKSQLSNRDGKKATPPKKSDSAEGKSPFHAQDKAIPEDAPEVTPAAEAAPAGATPTKSASSESVGSGEGSTGSRSGVLGALDSRKAAPRTTSESLQQLKSQKEPGRSSGIRGTEEWKKQRNFKSKLGEILRVKFDKSDMAKELKTWDVKGDGKIGSKEFQRRVGELGFTYTQSADKGEIDSMFESMLRHKRDGHIHFKDLVKMFTRLKQAAEAAVSEVADIAKTEQVMNKKIEELDVLEERIEQYYSTIDAEEIGLKALTEVIPLGVRLGNYLLSKFDINTTQIKSVNGWLSTWDKDGDGRIDKSEFSSQLVKDKIVELQPDGKPTKEEAKALSSLFDELDLDGDGRMSSKELRQALKKLQALAISHNADRKAHEVMIQLAKESVRSAEQAVLMVLNADDEEEELASATKAKQSFEYRLGDLFRKRSAAELLKEWDNNGDGNVNLKELQDALHLIGDEKSVTEFFESVDVDRSGTIEITEIKTVVARLQSESIAREKAVESSEAKVHESREAAVKAVKEAASEPALRRSLIEREANKAAGLLEDGSLPQALAPTVSALEAGAQGTPRQRTQRAGSADKAKAPGKASAGGKAGGVSGKRS